MCLREELNTAVEYLDHISAGCKVKTNFPVDGERTQSKMLQCYSWIFPCQCIRKYDNTMEYDQNESDVEQNESDNDYSCETPRKKLNTSLDTMGISPVHLHGVAQNGRASTAKK